MAAKFYFVVSATDDLTGAFVRDVLDRENFIFAAALLPPLTVLPSFLKNFVMFGFYMVRFHIELRNFTGCIVFDVYVDSGEKIKVCCRHNAKLPGTLAGSIVRRVLNHILLVLA